MLATTQALSNAAHNATAGQQNNGITAQAALVQGVNIMFAMDVASGTSVLQEFIDK